VNHALRLIDLAKTVVHDRTRSSEARRRAAEATRDARKDDSHHAVGAGRPRLRA
jgi:hypothetical protein